MSEARHIELDAVAMTVTATYDMNGSILAGTAEHRLHEIETRLTIESGAGREVVAEIVRLAERMCFVMDAITRPHEVARTVVLNGEALSEAGGRGGATGRGVGGGR